MLRNTLATALLAFAMVAAPLVHAQSAGAMSPPGDARIDVEALADGLAPGQSTWLESTPGRGGLLVVVDVARQRAIVYRSGQPIAVSTVSTGKPGRDTPTGVFPILSKETMHHSNLYDDAPMPFMQRLTWDGIALHAGHVPGYPASHGCVRLPKAFAEKLYGATSKGETVVIAADDSAQALLDAGLPQWQAMQVGRQAGDTSPALLASEPVGGSYVGGAVEAPH
jgi:lipoprotein-anchoring transpeptidase ErfK/SrfK